jgi:hypothetical protein
MSWRLPTTWNFATDPTDILATSGCPRNITFDGNRPLLTRSPIVGQ